MFAWEGVSPFSVKAIVLCHKEPWKKVPGFVHCTSGMNTHWNSHVDLQVTKTYGSSVVPYHSTVFEGRPGRQAAASYNPDTHESGHKTV